ncbi:MAG: saccharopine dehydrogenase family protein [Micropepsaceae bacterium]
MTRSKSKADARRYDVILVGATGYVGALIADYLGGRAGGNAVRWAVAGRSAAKLEAVKAALGTRGERVQVIVADTADRAAMDALAAQTKVVLTTVGPYAKYGSELVAACVDAGTDYCDLTGEAPWIAKMIDLHQDAAAASGARIVHCCGVDSIPSDLGVLFLNDEVRRRTGKPCSAIRMRVKSMKGGASGGTIASMMHLVEEAVRDPAVRAVLSNPYALNPKGARKGVRQPGAVPVTYDAAAGSWTAPFVMGAINSRVVQRSNALLDYAYGREFQYDEAMLTGGGVLGAPAAVALTGAMGAFGLAAAFPPTRALLNRFVLPKPGEGPTAEQRERGNYELLFVGTASDGRVFKALVAGDRDPGYGSTAKMISEAALLLAETFGDADGGVLTPASALGARLIERLREHAGLTFQMVD